MLPRLNITRIYTGRTYNEQFNQLEAIVSAPSDEPKYSIFGKYFLTEPVEFIFMGKWALRGGGYLVDIFSTKLKVKLFDEKGRAKMVATTESNPVFIGLFICLFLAFLLGLFNNYATHSNDQVNNPAIFLVYALIIGCYDRFSKHRLLRSFERNLKLEPS